MIRILVVDDATFIRNMVKKSLLPPDFEVVGEAADGNEAIKLYEELKPDVITMDITMRGMDGLTALEQIMKKNPDAKIIMLSSLGEESLIKKAINLGAKDFITKPFKPDRLISAVRAQVEN
ncbi:MAG: response regulator [Candidatus Hydrogenedentota bacterium]|nr:MAG: response regulator [Candidatus Hydrogenedentota bacterium]